LEKNNDLPKGWIERKIYELTESYSGGTPSTKNKEYWNRGKVPWIKSGEIKDNILKQSQTFISKKGLDNSSAKFYPPNTVLVAITGATTGKTAFLELEACGTQNVFGILPCEYIFPKYMWYYMRYNYTMLLSKVIGTAQKHVNGTIIKDTSIAFPSLNEQKRIVEKIEKLFSKLDNAKTTLEKTKLQQKQYKESLLKSAFEGKITEKWRDENECSVKSELNILRKINDQKLKSDSKLILETPENISNLPKISEKWIWVRLGFLSKVITKGASPKWQGIEYVDKGILFITSENVGSGRILLNKQKFLEKKFNEIQKRSILHRGDILTNIVGASIGRTAIYDLDNTANINQAVSLIRLCDMVNRNYIQYLLNSPFILNYMNLEKVDVARANLSLQNVADFPVPLPSLKEQEQIVLKLEQGFLLIQNSENITNSMLLQLETVRSSILKQAFEGKLVPQDPNDEPASELLKRIKSK